MLENYLKQGFSIIPLKPSSKIPINSWKKYTTQTIDATELKRYFGNNKNYNLGIVTGKISQLVVFDADTQETIDFLEKYEIFKNTLKVKTRRGLHYYIKVTNLSEDFPSQKIYHEKIRIDVKANNAYVVAPPSIVDNHKYEFDGSGIVQITQEELEDIIKALKLDLFPNKKEQNENKIESKNKSKKELLDIPENSTTINLEKLKKLIKKHYYEGNRQNLIMYAAGFLAKNGIDFDTAIAFVSELATEMKDPELKQRIAAVRHTYEDYKNGLAVKGLSGLIELGISEDELKEVFKNDELEVRVRNAITIPNITKLLEEYLTENNIKINYDTFYVKIFVNNKGIDKEIEVNIHSDLEEIVGKRIPIEVFIAAIEKVAYKNKTDRLIEFLEKCEKEWDGKPRIHSFFYDVFRKPLDQYTTTLAKNFFVSAVARAYNPGCFQKHILVIQGPQNTNKSRVLMALGQEWYKEINVSIATEKDFYMAIQGVWIAELPEMDALRKADRNRIKAVISSTTDRFRPPYSRNVSDFPRRCVFVCTTNEIFVYDDPSGGSRFWVIDVKHKGNVEYVRENRVQLWGEAVALFKSGYKFWEVDEKIAKKMQEAARKYDEWEHIIQNYVERCDITETTVFEIARDCLGITLNQLDKTKQMRIAECLTVLGFTRKVIWKGGKSLRVWVRSKKQKRKKIQKVYIVNLDGQNSFQ